MKPPFETLNAEKDTLSRHFEEDPASLLLYLIIFFGAVLKMSITSIALTIKLGSI